MSSMNSLCGVQAKLHARTCCTIYLTPTVITGRLFEKMPIIYREQQDIVQSISCCPLAHPLLNLIAWDRAHKTPFDRVWPFDNKPTKERISSSSNMMHSKASSWRLPCLTCKTCSPFTLRRLYFLLSAVSLADYSSCLFCRLLSLYYSQHVDSDSNLIIGNFKELIKITNRALAVLRNYLSSSQSGRSQTNLELQHSFIILRSIPFEGILEFHGSIPAP